MSVYSSKLLDISLLKDSCLVGILTMRRDRVKPANVRASISGLQRWLSLRKFPRLYCIVVRSWAEYCCAIRCLAAVGKLVDIQ